MKRFLEFGTPERTAFIKKVTPGEMPSGKFQEADHIKNMDVEIEEGSLDWEKDFKGYSKPNELKAIRGIIARNKDGIGGVIKMMKDDPKEFKKIVQKLKEEVELDEVYGTVKISGKSGRLVQHSPGEVVFVGNKKQAEKNLKLLKKDGGDGYIMQGVTIKVGEKVKGVEEERDYKDEYKKFQSTKKAIKYRAELNRYNRKRGTYGNNDGKDASHKNGKIVGFEDESTNRGRKEKSRLKVNETFKSFEEYFHESRLDDKLDKLVSNEIKKRKLAKFPVNATDDIKMRMKPNKPVFKFPSPNSDMMIHVYLRKMTPPSKKGMMAFNYQLEDK